MHGSCRKGGEDGVGHALKRKLLPQSPDCLPEEVTPYPSLSLVCNHLSILLCCLHSTLHCLEMAVLWPRVPCQAEPFASASPPPLRSQVAFDRSEDLGLPGGLGDPRWLGILCMDCMPLPLEPAQDACYQCREHVRNRQEELPWDSLRTLQGWMKQRCLDVRGAARWSGDHSWGYAHWLAAVKFWAGERDSFQAPQTATEGQGLINRKGRKGMLGRDQAKFWCWWSHRGCGLEVKILWKPGAAAVCFTVDRAETLLSSGSSMWTWLGVSTLWSWSSKTCLPRIVRG